MTPDDGEAQESLRDLAVRVIDDGTTYLKAEVTLAKEKVITRVKAARPIIGFLLVALMLAQGGLLLLATSFGFLLARWLGLPGGFATAGAIMIGVAALIGWRIVEQVRRIIR